MREHRQKALNAETRAIRPQPPVPPELPVISWINQPKEVEASRQ